MPRTKKARSSSGPADVGTLPKALKLLIALGDYPEGVRFTDLARHVDLAVSTTHRVLSTLVDHHFVEYNAERRLYALGLRVFELSHRVAAVRSLSAVALPVMRRLAEQSGFVVLLNVLDGNETVVLERAEPPRGLQVRTQVGTRLPLHSTASGKAILVSLSAADRDALIKGMKLTPVTNKTITDRREFLRELERVRDAGYAESNQENEEGIHSIAVTLPLLRSQRRIALSMAAPAYGPDAKRLISLLGALNAAAAEIAHQTVV